MRVSVHASMPTYEHVRTVCMFARVIFGDLNHNSKYDHLTSRYMSTQTHI